MDSSNAFQWRDLPTVSLPVLATLEWLSVLGANITELTHAPAITIAGAEPAIRFQYTTLGTCTINALLEAVTNPEALQGLIVEDVDDNGCAVAPNWQSTPTAAPAGWTCDQTWYADGQYCDCMCGTEDFDCLDLALPLSGCPEYSDYCHAGTCWTY